MEKIKIIVILSFLLIFPVFNPAFSADMTYTEAIGYAKDNFSTNTKIDNFYTTDIGTLSDSDNIIRTNTEGTNQLLMTSWSKASNNTSSYAGQKKTNDGYDVWLSPAQQLHTNLSEKGITNGSAVHEALGKTIGLDPTAVPPNDLVLEIWATRNNDVIQRATLNPAMNTLPINGTTLTAENINILSKSGYTTWHDFLDAASTVPGALLLAQKLAPFVKSNMSASGITWDDTQSLDYAKFIVKQVKGAYNETTPGAPWSGLGYTYDWAAPTNALDPSDWAKSIRGISEYVMVGSITGVGKEYQIGGIYSEQSYIYRVKSPVAGDSSTWSNGDFKITSDLNTLWTGRRFQPNGNSIEVTSAGNISGGQGILISSLGYTLNNAGSITSNSALTKFNIVDTDKIVVLFQGNSSDASSQTNTVINSGTIGNTSVATAIQATGETSITNSGTITGNLSFIDGKATITATAGIINTGNIGGTIMTKTGTTTDISLTDVTITGGSAANSINNIGRLNINAADVKVGGVTQVSSGILNVNSNTATFGNTVGDTVGVTGTNSRLISAGTTTFNGAVTISGGILSLYGTATMPSLSAGSTLDMQNGAINTVTSGNTTLTDNVNLYIDATGNSNDMFNTTGTLTTNNHDFILKSINLISTPQTSSFTLNNVIKAGSVVGTILIDTTQASTVSTAIGTYTLSSSGGSIFGNLSSFNPQVFRGQVATEASYANQLTTNNVLFDHIGLISEQLLSEEKPNVYANENPLFAPYQYSKKDGGIWYKAYGNLERLQLSQGINTQNNMWGSLVGADFPLMKLKNGWSLLPTAYIGYTGAYQTFGGVNMYQNGGQGGIMETFYKGDFITSLLANVGGYGNDMSLQGTKDITGNWFAGVASKSAYNVKLPKDFILQPTILLSYNAFGPQNWDTNYGSMSMTTNMMNGLNIAPGLNLILNKETWSVYATTQMMFNVMNGVSGTAGAVDVPTIKMGATYFQYGVGFTKRFKERLSAYAQIVFSNGVRTGVGFQGGLQWKL